MFAVEAVMLRLALVLLLFLPATTTPHRVYLPVVSVADDERQALRRAAAGVLLPSETDAPLTVRTYAEATPAAACAALGAEVRDVRALLAEFVANDPQWAPLSTALLGLGAPMACRAGGVEGAMHLLGVASNGEVIGVWGLSVET